MASSENQVLNNAQHFLECGNVGCIQNCQFYCNLCNRQLCEQCSDEHQKSPETKNHEIKPYHRGRSWHPIENCRYHGDKVTDMFCEECQAPICAKCAIQDHHGHAFGDLETVYSEKVALCSAKISKINKYFLPTTEDQKTRLKEDAKEIKTYMDGLRTSMKADAECLKRLVDMVMSKKMEESREIEQSLIDSLDTQDRKYDDYISYLNNLKQELNSYASKYTLSEMIFFVSDEKLRINPIPKTNEPILPEFACSAGKVCEEDITKLLLRLHLPDKEPNEREIPSMEEGGPLPSNEESRTNRNNAV